MFEVISIHEGKIKGLQTADRVAYNETADIVLLCTTDNVLSDLDQVTLSIKVTYKRSICAKCTNKNGDVMYAIFTPSSWDVFDCTDEQADKKTLVAFRTTCVNWSITPDKTDDIQTETGCDIDEAVRLLTQP